MKYSVNFFSVIFVFLMTLISFSLPVPFSFGEIYYVSLSGSDLSGNGSSESPWETITHALDNIPDDGSTILVKPGTYTGRVRLRGVFENNVVIRSEIPYMAKLRNDATVVTCYYGKGIILEGFDIAHNSSSSGALVIQIQDLIGEPGGENIVSDITLRNNILHDSYNNDILKINNGAGNILVSGNIFYNQEGSDEHIDVNSVTDVTIENNIFFNDFSGSGRTNNNDTSSYIVVKDSNGDDDTNMGSERITIRKNIFLNWEGSSGAYFVLIGEDGKPYYEAKDVTIENNLMIGNSANIMRAPFGVKGASDIVFRNNTITGDLPSMAFAMRLNTEGENLPCNNIFLYNNIWSDPTGTMGAKYAADENDFSDTPVGETAYYEITVNIYYNGGESIPFSSSETVNYTDDAMAIITHPKLSEPSSITLPRFNESTMMFPRGESTIKDVFINLVTSYAVPDTMPDIINQADISNAPDEDILGNTRTLSEKMVSIGAYQMETDEQSSLEGDFNEDGDVDGEDLSGLCYVTTLLSIDLFAQNFGKIQY